MPLRQADSWIHESEHELRVVRNLVIAVQVEQFAEILARDAEFAVVESQAAKRLPSRGLFRISLP